MQFEDWSKRWEEARCDVGNFELVLRRWRETPPKECKRLAEGRTCAFPNTVGYRKDPKDSRDKGEQKIERLFLGKEGELKNHFLKASPQDKIFKVVAVCHNVALATQKPGQRITDCLGVIQVGSKSHPLAVEVKVEADNCWFAVVENLQQIRMLKPNADNVRAYLAKHTPFMNCVGAWGMVLAPKAYYDDLTHHLQESEMLLDYLVKKKVEARIILAEATELEIARIRYRAGYWPK